MSSPADPALLQDGPDALADAYAPSAGPPRRRRRRHWAAILPAAACAAVLASTVPPKPGYLATTTIAIDAGGSPGEIAARLAREPSDQVLRNVVRRYRLADDPEFASGEGRDPLAALRGFLTRTPPMAGDARERAAAATLRARVGLARLGGSTVVEVSVTSPDPARAGRLADAVAQAVLAEWRPPESEPSGSAEPSPPDPSARGAGLVSAAPEAEAALILARGRTADAKARADAAGRIAAGGRFLDPLPAGLPTATLDQLRARYADTLRDELTEKTTLGERHPVLIETEQKLRDLRRDLGLELKRVAGVAVRALDAARAGEGAAERQARVVADVTGSLGARRASPDVEGAGARPERRDDDAGGRVLAPAVVRAAASAWPLSPALREVGLPALAAGAILLFGATFGGKGRHKPRAETLVRDEPNLAGMESGPVPTDTRHPDDVAAVRPASEGDAATPAGPAPPPEAVAAVPAVPVLAMIPPLEDPFAATVMDAFIGEALPPFGTALLGLHDTLLIATARRPTPGPLRVLVAALDADIAVALGLACAGARARRRVLMLEGTDAGLFRQILHPGARRALVDLGGTPKLAYGLGARPRDFCLVAAVPDEARAVTRAALDPATERLRGLEAFDLVVIAGSGTGADTRALAQVADLVLLAVRPGCPDATLAAARDALAPAKPCAAVMAEAPAFGALRAAA